MAILLVGIAKNPRHGDGFCVAFDSRMSVVYLTAPLLGRSKPEATCSNVEFSRTRCSKKNYKIAIVYCKQYSL